MPQINDAAPTPPPATLIRPGAKRRAVKGGVTGAPPSPGELAPTPPPMTGLNVQPWNVAPENITPDIKLNVAARLNNRASLLAPEFVQRYPAQAASLITSAVPTGKLADLAASYQQGLDFLHGKTSVDGVLGFLVPWYAKAFNALTLEARAAALAILDEVRKQPDGTQLAYFNSIKLALSDIVQPTTLAERIARLAGGALTAPFRLAGLAGGSALGAIAAAEQAVGLSHAAAATRGVRKAAGAAAKYGGEGLTYGLRVAEGVGATALRYGYVVPEVLALAHGNTETPWQTFTKYVPTWDEFTHGQISPVAQLFFDISGLDPHSYNGLAQLIGLGGDIMAGEAIVRGAMDVKFQRETPALYGGRYTSDEFLATSAGHNLVNGIWDKISSSRAPEGAMPEYLRSEFAHIDPAMARELARAATKDDVARIFAGYVDDIPNAETIAAAERALQDSIKAFKEAKALRESGPPELAGTRVVDEEGAPLRVYHGTTNEFGGFDLNRAQDGLYGPGIYFAEDPKVAARYAGVPNTFTASLRLPGDVSEQEALTRFRESYPTYGERVLRVERDLEPGGNVLWTFVAEGDVPNVHFSYLDIKNPFDTTKPLDTAVLDEIRRVLPPEAQAELDARLSPQDVPVRPHQYGVEPLPNGYIRVQDRASGLSALWDPEAGTWHTGALRGIELSNESGTWEVRNAPKSTNPLTNRDLYQEAARVLPNGASQLDTLLQDMGYDGIFHIGGRDGRVWVAFDPGQVHQGVSNVGPGTLRTLAADRIAAEQALQDLGARQPVLTWPSASRLRAIARGASDTPFGRFLSFFVRDNRSFAPGKLFNDLAQKQQYLDFSLGRPMAEELNAEVLRRNLDIAGVPQDVQAQLISRLGELSTSVDRYKWATQDYVNALREAITRGKRWRFTPELSQVLQIWKSELEGRMNARVSFSVDTPFGPIEGTRNVVETLDHRPLPSDPNQLLGDTIPLPNIDLLRQASSTIHQVDNWLKTRPGFGLAYRGLRVPLDITRFILFTANRMIGKSVLLVSRLFPLLKIQIDQGLRLWALDYKPIDFLERRNLVGLPGGMLADAGITRGGLSVAGRLTPEGDVTSLGVLAQADGGAYIPRTLPTRGLNPSLDTADAYKVVTASARELIDFSASSLARRLALDGPEKTLQWLNANPDLSLGGSTWAQYKAEILDHPDVQMSPESYLNLRYQQIQQLANTPELLKGLTSRRWDHPSDPTTVGDNIELVHWQTELDQARAAELAARRTGDVQLRLETGRRYGEIYRKVEELQKSLTQPSTIPFSNFDALVNALLEDWRRTHQGEQGLWAPPAEVLVRDRTMPEPRPLITSSIKADLLRARNFFAGRSQAMPGTPMSTPLAIEEAFSRIGDVLYKGLRPLNYLDVQLTRGSAYYQALGKIYDQLVGGGWDPETAWTAAQYRAAFWAKDLMYDLAARSSFDRATKDYFWFAPVVREQLTTWLYKIPAQAYWPIGAGIRTAEVMSLFQGMEQLGWVRRDPNASGPVPQYLLRIPGITPLLKYLTGGSGELRIDSINPVTPGGSTFWPTLAPGGEALLAMAQDYTQKHKVPPELASLITSISQFLTFDQGAPGTQWIPRGVVAAADLLGMRIPGLDFMSRTALDQQQHQANSQAVQYAMSTLLDQGVKPPTPGAPQAEWDHYKDLVMSEALRHEGGLSVVRAISSLFSPLSIVTTNSAASAYYAWRSAQGITYPYTPEDFAKIDAYTRAHPDALPFSIGRYGAIPPDQAILPDDAPFAAKLAAGDLFPMTGPDYFTKAVTIMGLVAEEARLRTELKAVSISSASDQLRNMSAYNTIYAQHLKRMSDWTLGNREIGAYLESKNTLTYDEQRLLDASRVLKILQSEKTWANPSDVQEIKIVQGLLGQAVHDISFGPAKTERQKQLNWYYSHVADPYYAKVDPLYRQAANAFEAGNDTLAYSYLDQVRKIADAQKERTHNGETFPTPEAVAFGGLSPTQQASKVNDWLLNRPASLTNFQMDAVGLPSFTGRETLATAVAAIDDRFYTAAADPHLTDAQTAQLITQHNADLARAAMPFGPQGQNFVRLAEGTPAMRLSYNGFGQDNLNWQTLVAKAQSIITFANAQYPPISYRFASVASGLFQRKVEFERQIDFMRSVDPSLDALFRQLEPIAARHGDQAQYDVPLYEHIFFGQANNAYNYQDPLVQAVEGSARGNPFG